MVEPGVDDADEGAVHPEVEPQQAEEARRHHALEGNKGVKSFARFLHLYREVIVYRILPFKLKYTHAGKNHDNVGKVLLL